MKGNGRERERETVQAKESVHLPSERHQTTSAFAEGVDDSTRDKESDG